MTVSRYGALTTKQAWTSTSIVHFNVRIDMDDFILAIEPEENGLEFLPDLDFLWSPFSVPRLEEKPQNPIIDTLRLNRNKAGTHGPPYSGQQAAFRIQEEEDELDSDKFLAAVPVSTENIWEQAISSQSPALVCLS